MGFKCNTPEGIELEVINTLIEQINQLRKSSYLELKYAALRINYLEVQQGSIMLFAQVIVQKIHDNIPFKE